MPSKRDSAAGPDVSHQNCDAKPVTASALMIAVWANNHSNDDGDSVEHVRQWRQSDNAKRAEKQERIATEENRSTEEIENSLHAQLGLAPQG
ncbi:hypothetical protein [Myceligenerans crystallogenes]|uniref:Uncharacterized protein n=1 Tax=Myceligenerans crystallogenes TaxID=316335 RepID=A0ABP4ZLJ5_9MICO